MKDKQHPAYYGILPAHVRYSPDLKPMEKIMYSEITALSNKDGHCSALNGYFADLYDVDPKTVGRWIKNLENFGFVDVESDPVSGHNRKIIPRDKKVTPRDKKITPLGQKDHGGGDKKITHNNTSIILQDNNSSKSDDSPKRDHFSSVPELKKKIGPKHYDLLNELGKDHDIIGLLRGMFHDGRFDKLIEWLTYKKEARQTYRVSRSLTKLIREFSDHTPIEVRKAVDTAIHNGHQGVYIKRLSDGKVKALFSNQQRKAL